jgi:ribokinase
VVVIGDVMTDVTVHSDVDLTRDLAHGSDTEADVRLGGGGAGGNVAAWLAFLGVDVGLVAALGADGAGDLAVSLLERRGVAVHAVRDAARPTGTVIALCGAGGERTMITDRGANVALSPRDLPGAWFGPGTRVHLSGYTLFASPARHAAIAALAMAASQGLATSVDPASWAPLQRVGPARFLAWTAGVDLCLPNAHEARLLTGAAAPDLAARRLGAHYTEAVVTAGAGGAVWSDGRETVRQPTPHCQDLRDDVGAGDAFTAGYLAALIRRATVDEALAAATDVAVLALQQRGPRPPGS